MIAKLSEKQRTAMLWWNRKKTADCCACIAHGAVRSGKTFAMSLGFVFWSLSRFDGNSFAYSKERAMTIAKEWSDGMQSARNGIVKDFVAVGDIDIKVIGAENQLIDTNVPVRQLLEQILSKLSIPPFLLGLNWTSTERMSAQQVDILTSELEYYRRLLTPVLRTVVLTFLRLNGCNSGVEIIWDNINLQDESELAKARLYNAQAEALEIENALKKQQIIRQEE